MLVSTCSPSQQLIKTYLLKSQLSEFHKSHVEEFIPLVEEKMKGICFSLLAAVQTESSGCGYQLLKTVRGLDEAGVLMVVKVFQEKYEIQTNVRGQGYREGGRKRDSNELFHDLGDAENWNIEFSWLPSNPHVYPVKNPTRIAKYQFDVVQSNSRFWNDVLNKKGTMSSLKLVRLT